MNTAVLFLTFNRLDTTKKVFAEIAKAQPPRLYLASDGPRETVVGEHEKVTTVREYLLQNISWECDVKTLFREENLGCKYAVSGAIDWFFDNEEQGIILEDDCLPDQSFFPFCEEMLDRYCDDNRVWHISGNNFQGGIKRGDGDYYFSRYNHVWGWASWRDRWSKYEVEIANPKELSSQLPQTYAISPREIRYWIHSFSRIANNSLDTWDIQYTFSLWKNRGAAICPQKNLISNIGFGEDATHTNESTSILANLPTGKLLPPYTSPSDNTLNSEADVYTASLFRFNKTLIYKLFRKIVIFVKRPF